MTFVHTERASERDGAREWLCALVRVRVSLHYIGCVYASQVWRDATTRGITSPKIKQKTPQNKRINPTFFNNRWIARKKKEICWNSRRCCWKSRWRLLCDTRIINTRQKGKLMKFIFLLQQYCSIEFTPHSLSLSLTLCRARLFFHRFTNSFCSLLFRSKRIFLVIYFPFPISQNFWRCVVVVVVFCRQFPLNSLPMTTILRCGIMCVCVIWTSCFSFAAKKNKLIEICGP